MRPVLLALLLISPPALAECQLADTAEIVVISHETLKEVDGGCQNFHAEAKSSEAEPRTCNEEQELWIREASRKCDEHARDSKTQL